MIIGGMEMKKSFYTAAVILFVVSVVSGCSVKQESKEKETTKQQTKISEVSKAQKIQIISLKDQKTAAVIKDKDEIRSLIEDLKIDQWETVKSVPEGAKAVYRCDLYQAGTQKLNRKKPGSMKKLGSLTFYEDSPYVNMKVLAFRLNFKIPVDAVQILEKL